MKPQAKVLVQKGVIQITAFVVIKASQEEVWEILKFPGKIDTFHPLVKSSYTIGESQTGLGVKRRCELSPMGVMEEKVIEWEEGKSFTAEVQGGKMLPPYRFMRGQIKLESSGKFTKATFAFTYQLKFGWLGRIMDQLLVRPQFKKAPPQYVSGLKNYAERQTVRHG